MPQDLRELLQEDHLVRFIMEVVGRVTFEICAARTQLLCLSRDYPNLRMSSGASGEKPSKIGFRKIGWGLRRRDLRSCSKQPPGVR
jgi:hypothetical protein